MTAPRTGSAITQALSSLSSLSSYTSHRALCTAPSSWIQDLPTRAIADSLLGKEQYLFSHEKLYEEVNESGLFRSHRHFKHCLKMMRTQNRVKIVCNGPERIASAKLAFSVKLTAKGRSVYRYYREQHARREVAKREQAGLKDALP